MSDTPKTDWFKVAEEIGLRHDTLERENAELRGKLEQWEQWAAEMISWAESNGLDVTARKP